VTKQIFSLPGTPHGNKIQTSWRGRRSPNISRGCDPIFDRTLWLGLHCLGWGPFSSPDQAVTEAGEQQLACQPLKNVPKATLADTAACHGASPNHLSVDRTVHCSICL